MSAERFMQLVVENHGFEFVQAYKDDVDLFLGGKDGTFWYVVMKNGKVKKRTVSVFVYDPEFEWQEKYGKRHIGAIPNGYKIWYGKKGTWKYVKQRKMN